MNIYDFDNTIFKGDSSIKFIKYSLIRHPLKVLRSMLKTIKELIKYLFKKSNLGNIKSELFSFVKYLNDFEEYMDIYVEKMQKNIKKFYLENQKDNDLVISASFDFIIERFCHKLEIKNVIATKYDVKNGCIIGLNCKGLEKVNRLKKEYPNAFVNDVYSDSLSDIPILKLGKKAYLVKGNKIEKMDF